MANYSGERREFYNIRRQLQSSIKSFEKAGMAPPPAFYSSRVRRILETTPAKASKGLISEARIVKNQIAFSPKRFRAEAYIKNRAEVLHRLSATPEEGGLGYTAISDVNMDMFFDFMDAVREKFENMQFDSDVYAAAGNELFKMVQKRKVSAQDLEKHFERFMEQAVRATEKESYARNYARNFNQLARRLGL